MRSYKRKHAGQWHDKDRRMVLAAQMRGQGMSLRQIAKELAVGVGTVHRDLARWDAQPNTVSLFQSGVPSRPQRGDSEHPDGTPELAVTELRRRA